MSNIGKIVQVIGPVIDVEFEAGHLPEIYNALHERFGSVSCRAVPRPLIRISWSRRQASMR